MSDTLQVADLVNGKLDVETIAEVAMVGTTADTTTNRDGVEVDTLEGRLKKVGFEPPVAYSAGIEFLTPADAVKSFDQGGIIYGCLASSRPFTTTGNFAADEVNFFVIQNTAGVVQGNVRTDFDNTYDTGTTQNFDGATADTLIVDGVDFTDKNAAQDQATADAASAASTADGKAVAAQSTANTANSKANTANSTANANTSAISNLSNEILMFKLNADGTATGLPSGFSASKNSNEWTLSHPSGNYVFVGTVDSTPIGGSPRVVSIGSSSTTQVVFDTRQLSGAAAADNIVNIMGRKL